MLRCAGKIGSRAPGGIVACLVVALQWSAPLQAQDPPDADYLFEGLQQQREREGERRREGERPDAAPVITGPSPETAELPETEDTFELKAIEFNESRFIDAERLELIARAYTGRPVDFAALNRMTDWINHIYADLGVVTARAIIPAQRVDDGVLQVLLVEGRLGEIEIRGLSHQREDRFRHGLAPLEQGEVLDLDELRETLTWINQTQETQLEAALRAGAQPGETDVVITAEEPTRYSVLTFVDNLGSETTGETRAGVNVGVFSPLGYGDRLSVLAMGSEGSEHYSVSYRLPVNARGGTVELRHTWGEIEIIDGPFRELEVEGETQQTEVTYSQPLTRGQWYWWDVEASASRSESETTILGADLSEFTTDRLGASVRVTGFGERSQWTLRPGLEAAQVEDIFGERESVTFFEGRASYSRALGLDLLGTLRGAWQYTDETGLPSPLLFQVGGANSVRGYEQGALSGARGFYVNAEVGWHGHARVTTFGFVDHGLVDDISPDREQLTSVGAGARLDLGAGLEAEVTYGMPLRDTLPDQDSHRVHATLSWHWSG